MTTTTTITVTTTSMRTVVGKEPVTDANIWLQALGGTALISAVPAVILLLVPIDPSKPSSQDFLKVLELLGGKAVDG